MYRAEAVEEHRHHGHQEDEEQRREGRGRVTHDPEHALEELHPKNKHLVGAGALGGAFWGMLIGLIFLMPLAGMALGAAFGALGGKLGDMGLDKEVLEEIGDSIKPGETAWFLLVRSSTRDRVVEELAGTKAKVIRTNLSEEQEANLREMFSGEKA